MDVTVESFSASKAEIPGGWSQRKMLVGDREFDMIVPADPDALFGQVEEADQLGEAEPDIYWAALWPAAIPMATAMLNSELPRGTHALELGTGIGLPGIAASARGCTVTVSDYVPISVALAVHNAQRNGLSVRGLLLDWREPQDERFPLILGADILYDANRHGDLLNVLDKMLCEDGQCWIGDPGRYHFRKFIDRAASRGFVVRVRDESGNEMLEPVTGQFQVIVLTRQ